MIDNLKAGVIEANFYEPVVQRTYALLKPGFIGDKYKVARKILLFKNGC